MTHPTDDDWKRILKMVDLIYQRPDAEPFREPVPWKALGLVDYPTIISKPMDLGTIKEKIKKRSYKTLYQVNEDVRTVWSNCMTYNADGSDFYKLAELLKTKWDDKYKKLINDISAANPTGSASGAGGSDNAKTGSATAGESAAAGAIGSDSGAGTKASLSEKRNFAKLLYQISKEDLGKVLVDVEARHPAAIKRNATEDEVVLNIDEIPAQLLQELHNFVASSKTGTNAGGGSGTNPSSTSKKKAAPGTSTTTSTTKSKKAKT